ncbi:MAG TPA: hypothetical protein V6C95_11620 [Coleofasciculaceae cyanobacterium]
MNDSSELGFLMQDLCELELDGSRSPQGYKPIIPLAGSMGKRRN